MTVLVTSAVFGFLPALAELSQTWRAATARRARHPGSGGAGQQSSR
jgi:hypothetical protein